jgi:hypothetical protein
MDRNVGVIQYCRVHKAAPALLTAAKEVLRLPLRTKYTATELELREKARNDLRAAILSAESHQFYRPNMRRR